MIFQYWNLAIFTGPILTLPEPTPLTNNFDVVLDERISLDFLVVFIVWCRYEHIYD